MTDEELRIECLKIAAMHYFPRNVGFGMPNDSDITSVLTELANDYYGYIKTGSIINP